VSGGSIVGADIIIRDLDRAAGQMIPQTRLVVEASTERLLDGWRANARATSGKHGKRYPSSITSEGIPSFGAITTEVGPENSRRQGGMGRGFELGSVNQPPHLDGKRAADAEGPKLEAALEALIAGIL
jgi:hypothetical protein